MNFIIFDLEATCWEGKPPSKVQEIIEIGAVKLDDYGEVQDTFARFVKPVIHPYLSHFCQQLTHIDQDDINRAAVFPKVVQAFTDWIDIYDEDYLLCSWGGFDRKMLVQDCRMHRLEHEWAEQHINLKQQYHEIRRLRRTRGLRHAVKAEGFEFTGEAHRAFDDAHNLAKIFKAHLDEWRF